MVIPYIDAFLYKFQGRFRGLLYIRRHIHNITRKLIIMKKSIIGLVLATLCTPALSAEGRWTEGYGQGNLEYFIDKQGFRLNIGCPTQDGSADSSSSVSLSKLSDSSGVEQFTITANGITYDAPFEASSRVGENNFISLMESLRKGNAVVKFGKKAITFPKSNAAKVVPLFGTKGFSCNLG